MSRQTNQHRGVPIGGDAAIRQQVAQKSLLGYIHLVMSQVRLIKLQCSKCKRINYWSSKNKKLVTRKIELKKYCKWCRLSTPHKEAKK